jgi:hypothetical protein
LTEVLITYTSETFAANITHGVSACANEFVATLRLDERNATRGTCPLDSVGSSALKG